MSLTRRAAPEVLAVLPSPAPPGPRRWSRPVGAVLLALLSGCLAAALLGVVITGAAQPSVLVDPGPLVRWGLPVARGIADLAACLSVGALVLAATVLPVRPGRSRPVRAPAGGGLRPGRAASRAGVPPRAHPPALLVATLGAGGWALAALAVLVLSYADVAGSRPDAPGFGDQLGAFVLRVDLGRDLALSVGFAALLALLAAGASTVRSAGLLALLALAGLSPQAFAGHASGPASHETAVSSLGLHLIGVTIWVGGLAALLLLWRGLGPQARPVAAARFSTLAAWCFAAVAASGLVNAWIRVGGLDGLRSSYGVLLGLKAAALVGLGAAGWWHRRRSLAEIGQGRAGLFARLAVAEIALMAVAVGFAVALSRSAPPVPAVPPARPSPAQALTGYPLPPRPTGLRWLTEWQPDLFWLLLIGLGAGLYAAGVVRLHRRGTRWPLSRTLPWAAGLLVCLYVTCGPPAAYGRLLFSSHMLGHMLQGMVVPILLVLGAPVTLALRALPARRDGSRGPREWLLAALHCWPSRLLTHPVVAGVLFAGGLLVFYYSPLFRLALSTHLGHEAMHLHFLLAGYLFAWVLVGVDPGPRRPPSPPLRMLLLLAVMAFHAFLGVALLTGSTVLAADWFAALHRPWGGPLLADQRLGGGIAWAIGEIPTVLLEVLMAVQWSRSDEREARRRDRKADRDGDAELVAYNEMLAGLASRERIPQPTGGSEATSRADLPAGTVPRDSKDR